MHKTVEARVSVSSNPAMSHIGRYFVDVRDTTNGADRQMTYRYTDNPAGFVTELTTAGVKAGVLVELVDNTGE
jgi:hypothetical protein